MSQTVQRYRNKRRRGWRDPFDWFWWFGVAVGTPVPNPGTGGDLVAEDGQELLAEDGQNLISE